ncbi:SUMF1/EgtB/PvdO family nonheme iron enzyme [Ideonella sp. 4Y16]|uniref:SUMF1/EgtB/PvdO family nonheme iron enzyme n=1 Tax=Ideonella alba TaxID=2824118 RepID=UPI001B3914FD|nr:SUMF1/EgtB/PvdO family nonheme iron enzyme [Ideonella alba]MBQ0942229.1 SUMF1/EgtB/PvdO family nonheme iron enzyme [Ideonella alba]
MHHFLHPSVLENRLINQAVDVALTATHERPALPSEIAWIHLGRAFPPWLLLCHQVYFESAHRQAGQGMDARVAHALQARQGALQITGFAADDGDAHCRPAHAGGTHFTPAQVAFLAAQAAAGQPEPDDLQAALLARCCVQGGLPPPDLSLRVLLVGGWQYAHGASQPAWLDLWRVPEPGRRLTQPLSLVRAPGAVLLPGDAVFETSLQRVQALLRAVLHPDAPSLAFSLRPATVPGQDEATPLSAITGASASVSLALGALWLLQDHLQAPHAALQDQLQDLALERLVVSAALGELPDPAAGVPPWPSVHPVGGMPHKQALFELLDDADRDDGGTGLLLGTAARQPGLAHDPSHADPETLPAFIERLCRTAGSGLASPEARRLHHLLVQDDADIADTQLIEAVRAQPRPATLKAWLVWRWAQRAGGPDAAFSSSPHRLAQRYTQLTLASSEKESNDPSTQPEKPQPPQPYRLEQLLDDPAHAHHAGWLIDAAPFAGKSTLLAWREMGAARRALQALRGVAPLTPYAADTPSRPVDHIEVCVLLPLREWKPQPADEAGLRQQFEQFLFDSAPLQRWWPRQAAPGQPPQAAPPLPWLRHGIRLRLCLDGLNEFSAATDELRQAALHALCNSLALRQALLLPPIFTVRERERSLLPHSPLHPGWRLAQAKVEAWSLDACAAYIDQAGLQADAAQSLKRFLQPPQGADAPPDWADPYAHFRSFCTTPGFLAAQCTLLRWRPGRAPATRRSDLFSALLWYALNQDLKDPVPTTLLPAHLKGDDALKAAEADHWRLQDRSMGLLVDQLLATAAAMVDQRGLPEYDVSADRAAPGLPLHSELRQQWLDAVRRLGLATLQAGRFAFVHQQWHEFLLALARERGADLPENLAAPALNPSSEDLLAHLQQEDARLELPTVSPHHERLRFTAELSGDPVAWIRRLLPLNLPLAARIAIDHQHLLEPDGPYPNTSPGDRRRGPHGVLQLLRHVLLLTQSDAGARLKPRIRTSGVLGIVEAPVLNLPADDPLQAWWAQRLRAAFQPQEVDLRLRIEAGFLLGELGDNLRYELVTAQAPEGDWRTGLRLKAALWAVFGKPGRKQRFVIGASRWDKEAKDNEKPACALWLDAFAMARLPVTVAEWRWFAKKGYDSADAPWWRAVGGGARSWVRDRPVGLFTSAWALGDSRVAQAAQPMLCLSPYEAQAYVAWCQPLYMQAEPSQAPASVAERWPVRVPPEGQWEAGVRGPAPWWSPWLRALPRWPFEFEHAAAALLVFNHGKKLNRTAPVGSFSAGVTAHGVFDACGQVWEWCASRQWDFTYRTIDGRREMLAEWFDDQAARRVAARGGTFFDQLAKCRPSCRFELHLGQTGVRLVRTAY